MFQLSFDYSSLHEEMTKKQKDNMEFKRTNMILKKTILETFKASCFSLHVDT